MSKNVKPLLARAKDLRPDEKLALVNALLEDLDRPDPAIEEAWAIEAKRRLAAMQSGRMRSYSLAQVFGKYKKCRWSSARWRASNWKKPKPGTSSTSVVWGCDSCRR